MEKTLFDLLEYGRFIQDDELDSMLKEADARYGTVDTCAEKHGRGFFVPGCTGCLTEPED